MARLLKHVSKKVGMTPGSLVYVGEKRTEPVKIQIFDFTDTALTEKAVEKAEDCYSYRDSSSTTWINVTGIHDTELIGKLGNHFGIHPLNLEDLLNTGQRPKLQESEQYLFIVLKMLYIKKGEAVITSEQVSLLAGKNYVISFQEEAQHDVFEAIRERIRKTVPRVRLIESDYLAYALLDAVVDHYFVIIEHLGDQIELVEEQLVRRPATENLQTIHELKRELIFMRKAVYPLREVIGGLDRT